MPFREDDDAIRARVDALAEEVADLKAERDALVAERAAKAAASKPEKAVKPEKAAKAAKAPKPTKSPNVDAAAAARVDRQANIVGWIVGGVCGLVLLVAIVQGLLAGRKRDALRAQHSAVVKARNAATGRWQALVAVEPCARQAAMDEWYTRDAMARARRGPHDASAFVRALQINCTDGASALRADTSTQAPVKLALDAWLDAEQAVWAKAKPLHQYLSDDDWKEDDFRAVDALWEGLKAALDQRDVALGAVRRQALPLLRDEIRAKGVAHEKRHGRDAVAWRIELGLLQWDMEDAATRVMEEPTNPVATTALHDQVAKLLDATSRAPIEVRRDVRRTDYLTAAVLAGQVLHGDNLANLIRPDTDLLGHMRDSVPNLPELPDAPPDDD